MTFKSPMEDLGGGKAILGFVGPHMTKISTFHKGPGCIVFFTEIVLHIMTMKYSIICATSSKGKTLLDFHITMLILTQQLKATQHMGNSFFHVNFSFKHTIRDGGSTAL